MTQSSIQSRFLKYTSLNILGMLGMSCYIMADTFFIAKALGPDGLTALNFCISVFSILQGFGLMIGIGGATRYAIHKANNNQEAANHTFLHAMVLAAVAAVLFLIMGLIFSAPIASMLGADKDTLPLAVTYLQTILSFSPCFLVNNVLLAFIRNDQNPRLSMTAMLVSSLSNVVLDYLFIFPLHLDMFGAAFATGLSPIISLGILSTHFMKKRNGFHLTKAKVIGKQLIDILSLGASSFVAELSSAVALITFNLVILKIEGNTGVAAYGIVANIALIVTAIFTGTAQGIQPLVSQSYGEGNHRQARQVYKYGFLTAIMIAVVVYIIIFVAKAPIASIFNNTGDLHLAELSVMGMSIYFTGFFFAGINIITAAFFSASARAAEAFLISILRSVLLLVPAVLLCSHMLGMTGVWLSFVITELLVCILSIWRSRKHKSKPEVYSNFI